MGLKRVWVRDRVRIHSRGCQPAADDKVCRTDDKGSTASGPPPRLPTCQPPGTPAAVAAQLEAGATAAVATATAAHRHRARRAVLERAMAGFSMEERARGTISLHSRGTVSGRSAAAAGKGWVAASPALRRRLRPSWIQGAAAPAWQRQPREAALASRRGLQGRARGCTCSYAQTEEPRSHCGPPVASGHF